MVLLCHCVLMLEKNSFYMGSLLINCLWWAINKNYLGNSYWHYLFQFFIFALLFALNSFLHLALFSVSLPFFFSAVFIKIGFLFLLFILIDWFYGWRKSLTFKPVNPSVRKISWFDLIWNIRNGNAVEIKVLQVQQRAISTILTPIYIDRHTVLKSVFFFMCR